MSLTIAPGWPLISAVMWTPTGPISRAHAPKARATRSRPWRGSRTAGARRANARRFVVQSYAGASVYERTGGPVKTEGDPLDPSPPSALRPTYEAIRYLERSVMAAGWVEPVVLSQAPSERAHLARALVRG